MHFSALIGTGLCPESFNMLSSFNYFFDRQIKSVLKNTQQKGGCTLCKQLSVEKVVSLA